MRPKARAREKKTKLPEGLEKRLAVYALAAAAGGVGVLALAPAAKADIITGTGTPISMSPGNSPAFLTIGSNQVLSFVDNETTKGSSVSGYRYGSLAVNGIGGAAVMLGPLAKSALIGPSATFQPRSILALNQLFWFTRGTSSHLRTSDAFSTGMWKNTSGYLGFKFFNTAGTKSYFGWAHLSVTDNPQVGDIGKISSFAFEGCAGEGILAGQTTGGATCSQPTNTPEPSTLSLLAMGAVGLFALRRKKFAATN